MSENKSLEIVNEKSNEVDDIAGNLDFVIYSYLVTTGNITIVERNRDFSI